MIREACLGWVSRSPIEEAAWAAQFREKRMEKLGPDAGGYARWAAEKEVGRLLLARKWAFKWRAEALARRIERAREDPAAGDNQARLTAAGPVLKIARRDAGEARSIKLLAADARCPPALLGLVAAQQPDRRCARRRAVLVLNPPPFHFLVSRLFDKALWSASLGPPASTCSPAFLLTG